MSGSDEGFGPSQRGGRSGRRGKEAPPPGPRRPDRGDDRRHEPPGGRAGAATARPRSDDEFGPVQRGRGSRLPRPRRPTRGGRARQGRQRPAATRVLAVLAVVLLAYGGGLALLATARLDRTQVDGLQTAGVLRTNVLVAGTDTREGFSDEELGEIGTNRVGGTRADSLFLLSTRGTNAAILALPRDLYVTRCDGQRARINSAGAEQVGGPSCLVRTVADLTGLRISHYLELDLAGFVDVVDAVGGVDMTLEEPLVDRKAGADLPAGPQRLTGAQALSFVRSRQQGGDLGRIERQQEFMSALTRRLASPTTLLNPVRLVGATNSGAAALTANWGFGPLTIARLGLAVGGGDMPTYTVPASPQTIGGAAVLVPEEAAARELFQSFADGSALREPAP